MCVLGLQNEARRGRVGGVFFAQQPPWYNPYRTRQRQIDCRESLHGSHEIMKAFFLSSATLILTVGCEFIPTPLVVPTLLPTNFTSVPTTLISKPTNTAPATSSK